MHHREAMIELKQFEFEKIKHLIYTKFGINLTQEKFALVEARLIKTLIEQNMNSFNEFYNWVTEDKTNRGLSLLIDKISTNHTYFYRENEHFLYILDHFQEFLKLANQDEQNELRIWSAGCSYGDEPYTYAIILHDFLEKNNFPFRFKILATDINQDAIKNAEIGIYDEARLSYLPKYLRLKYFLKQEDGLYQIKETIKQFVLFRRLNFMNETFPFKKQFHIISCRNVMIYFDQKTKDTLLNKFHRLLNPKGVLFIGHSESITSSNSMFKIIQPAIFKPLPMGSLL